MLMVSAGLQSIDGSVLDAARVDGAGWFSEAVHIILPALRNVMFIVMLILVVWALNSLIAIWILTQGGPAGATSTMPIYIYSAFRTSICRQPRQLPVCCWQSVWFSQESTYCASPRRVEFWEKKQRSRPGTIIAYVILIALLLFALAPVALMIGTAFKPNVEIFQVPPRWLPRAPTLSNFHTVMFNSGIPRYALNSVIIATLMTFTALVLGTMAGYGFSRFKFRGNRALSLFMLLGQLIPLIALIVPFFQIFDAVGLLDTRQGSLWPI